MCAELLAVCERGALLTFALEAAMTAHLVAIETRLCTWIHGFTLLAATSITTILIFTETKGTLPWCTLPCPHKHWFLQINKHGKSFNYVWTTTNNFWKEFFFKSAICCITEIGDNFLVHTAWLPNYYCSIFSGSKCPKKVIFQGWS